MKRIKALVTLVPAFAVAACASVLGVEDGVRDLAPDRGDGSAGDGPINVSPGVPDGASPVDAAPIGVDVPDTCPSEQPDPQGVFVSLSGSAKSDCGSKDAPCA